MDKNRRRQLYEIIFESDTPAGKLFDVGLLIAIALSVITVICESVPQLREDFAYQFILLEWVFTIIFSVEYILRIYSSYNRVKYIFSFYGLIDLLAILPAFIGIFIIGAHSFMIIRAFRLLRVFRVLKVSRYSKAGETLLLALRASREKIGVFLFTIFTTILLIGTLMYLIEGEVNGFTSIPKSIYWAVVTITTVGYGDITPQTALGQFFSGLLMILGYAIIAVPTGIISVEVARTNKLLAPGKTCPNCNASGLDSKAKFCSNCGASLT
jgi:voltage-gated potassium channel